MHIRIRKESSASVPVLPGHVWHPATLAWAVSMVLLVAAAGPSLAEDYWLSWDAPQSMTDGSPANPSVYCVYFGAASGSYPDAVLVTNQTSLSLAGLTTAPTVYFSVTAVEGDGTESAFSEEIVWERIPNGVDSDADGQPDAWELAHFGTVSVVPQADADGDGRSNLREFVEGSNPVLSDAGVLLQFSPVGGTPKILFVTRRAEGPGYEGLTRHYTLESTGDPLGDTWSPVPGCTAITGLGQTETYLPDLGDGFAWWRLSLWLE